MAEPYSIEAADIPEDVLALLAQHLLDSGTYGGTATPVKHEMALAAYA